MHLKHLAEVVIAKPQNKEEMCHHAAAIRSDWECHAWLMEQVAVDDALRLFEAVRKGAGHPARGVLRYLGAVMSALQSGGITVRTLGPVLWKPQGAMCRTCVQMMNHCSCTAEHVFEMDHETCTLNPE